MYGLCNHWPIKKTWINLSLLHLPDNFRLINYKYDCLIFPITHYQFGMLFLFFLFSFSVVYMIHNHIATNPFTLLISCLSSLCISKFANANNCCIHTGPVRQTLTKNFYIPLFDIDNNCQHPFLQIATWVQKALTEQHLGTGQRVTHSTSYIWSHPSKINKL